MVLKKAHEPRNIDTAIVAVAQLMQPCMPEVLLVQAIKALTKFRIDKRQIQSRIIFLESNGFLWSRTDKQLLVTPSGFMLSKSSMSSKERDKYRLYLLNNSRYK